MPVALKVEIIVAPGCSSRRHTRELVTEIIHEIGIYACLEETVITSPEQALGYHFLGSPSVRINGKDVETDATEGKKYGMG